MDENQKIVYDLIKKNIDDYVRQGEHNYIIYPFGENGRLTKEVLENEFGIQPACILDNDLCSKYDHIQDVDYIKDLDPNEHIVLFAVGNSAFYNEARLALYKHVKRSRIVELFRKFQVLDGRVDWLADFSEFIYAAKISGNVAECGVFHGDFARVINILFLDRKCYLFDSFNGFKKSDVDIELSIHDSSFFDEEINCYQAAKVSHVISRMVHQKNIILKKGYIPDTFTGLEDEFCFVSLDVCLYQPTFESLKFFYPRMVHGGIILLHDYFDPALVGISKSVLEYENMVDSAIIKLPMRAISSLAIVKSKF